MINGNSFAWYEFFNVVAVSLSHLFELEWVWAGSTAAYIVPEFVRAGPVVNNRNPADTSLYAVVDKLIALPPPCCIGLTPAVVAACEKGAVETAVEPEVPPIANCVPAEFPKPHAAWLKTKGAMTEASLVPRKRPPTPVAEMVMEPRVTLTEVPEAWNDVSGIVYPWTASGLLSVSQ